MVRDKVSILVDELGEDNLQHETNILSALNSAMGNLKDKMPLKRMLELHKHLLNFAEMARIAAIEMLLEEGFTGHVEIAHEEGLEHALEDYA